MAANAETVAMVKEYAEALRDPALYRAEQESSVEGDGKGHALKDHLDVKREDLVLRRDEAVSKDPYGNLKESDCFSRFTTSEEKTCRMISDAILFKAKAVADYLENPNKWKDERGKQKYLEIVIRTREKIGEGVVIGDKEGAAHGLSNVVVAIAPSKDEGVVFSVVTAYPVWNGEERIECLESVAENLVDMDRKDSDALTDEEAKIRDLENGFLDVARDMASLADVETEEEAAAREFDVEGTRASIGPDGWVVGLADEDGRVTKAATFDSEESDRWVEAKEHASFDRGADGRIEKTRREGGMTNAKGEKVEVLTPKGHDSRVAIVTTTDVLGRAREQRVFVDGRFAGGERLHYGVGGQVDARIRFREDGALEGVRREERASAAADDDADGFDADGFEGYDDADDDRWGDDLDAGF